MNILVIDQEDVGLAFCLRCLDAGHEVRYWNPKKFKLVGQGMVEKPQDWRPSMPWADLIVLCGNAMFGKELKPFFDKGFPIFGANEKGAELELDRKKGQEVMKAHDLPVLSSVEFTSYKAAIEFVQKTGKAYACKPWGGEADKALSCVADSPEDLIFMLKKWETLGLKASFILQEKAEGIEMGVAAWFGPGGWGQWIEENWEEKKFMNEGLGCNTGEQGTILRYTQASRLFDLLLEPLTEYFHKIGYVGCVSINTIIDEQGIAWPLEFTNRLGWPAFNLEMNLVSGDPAKWMLDLLQGKDTMEGIAEIACGVCMTHGDYPSSKQPVEEVAGFPLRGFTDENASKVMLQSAMIARAPARVGGHIFETDCICTAGDYVAVAVGTGTTVSEAQYRAYDTAWAISWPSNRMFRTDIGSRLREELPALQRLGFAIGVEW